jgi:nucleoside-diphosphate-sugar epimerase
MIAMNVLITGGTGNLGSRLTIPLVQRGDRVVAFDIRSEPHFDSAEFRQVQVVVGDLADREQVLGIVREHKIDTIFHLGAVLSASAEENPFEAWRANMDGMINVLDAAHFGDARSVVFSSTIATYGSNLPEPLTLDAPQWPVSLYGVTKVAGERLGVYYQQQFGLDFRAIRLPAVIAARGAGGGASAYVSAAFEQSVFKGEYEFYVNPTTRAPMLYIADAVRGFLDLHDAPAKNLSRRVYNIGAIAPSAEELAQAIRVHVPEVLITYRPDALKCAIVESWPHRIDDSAAQKDWGWESTWNLERTTTEVIEVLRHESTSQ